MSWLRDDADELALVVDDGEPGALVARAHRVDLGEGAPRARQLVGHHAGLRALDRPHLEVPGAVTDRLRWSTPMPPARAIAMAMRPR